MKWRHVCVTGASSGLGRALCFALARQGYQLTITGRDPDRLEEVRLAVSNKSPVITCCADLTVEADVDRLCEVIVSNPPDVLIVNAGIGSYGRFVDTENTRSLEIVQVNITALLRLTHAWCQAYRPLQKPGKIVFIASMAALMPIPGMAVYAASKAFVLSFAEALRFELRDSQLGVLTVCPGQFATNFQRRAANKPLIMPVKEDAQALAEEIVQKLDITGVYIPKRWRWMARLQKFMPRRLMFARIEKEILGRVRP